MNDKFLDSILSGVNEIGWCSVLNLCKHTDWWGEDVDSALENLVKSNKIQKRKRGRGYQYGPLEKIEKIEIQENIYDPPIPSDSTFNSLDTFLLEGIKALPKNCPFFTNEFAEALLRAFPKCSYQSKDIVNGIAKLVRLNRLELKPYMDDITMKYQYIVK